MKNSFFFALAAMAGLLFASSVSHAQSQISTILSNEGKVSFTVTKSNVSVLLSQKGHITNLSLNASGEISYDLHNRIDQIGNVKISYDIHDRIDEIGNTEISYDIHGRIDKIGKDEISYDLSGRVTKIGRTEIIYRFTTGNIESIKDR